MTAETTPAEAEQQLPKATQLTMDQKKQLACALCRRRLFADRFIGTIPDGYGGHLDLWACAPTCPKETP